jgi:O-antigen/teichoic acid export membrane protein
MNFVKQIKSVSKDSIYYGLGESISKFISFLTAPILTRIFTPGEYGLMDFITITFTFFMIFAGVNVFSGIYRYYYEVKTFEDKKKLVSTGFHFILIMSAFFLILLFALKPQIVGYVGGQSNIPRDYSLYLTIVFLRTPFLLAQLYFLSLFRLRREPKKFILVAITQVLLNFGLIIFLVVVLDMKLVGAFLAGTISMILISVLSYFFHQEYIRLQFSKDFFKKIMHYALPEFPAIFFNWGILHMNRFFVYEYCSETQLGYFAIALKVSMVMQIAVMAFRAAWDPFSMELMQKPDHKEIYSKFYRIVLMAFTFFAFLLTLISKPVLFLIAPSTYLPAFNLIVVLVFAYTLDISNRILAIGIAISKKTKYASYASAITFVFALLFNYFLIRRHMAFGAALALLASYIVKTIFTYMFGQMVYPIKFPIHSIKHYFLIFIISINAVLFVKDKNWLVLLVVNLSVALIVLSYTYFIWIKEKERQKIRHSVVIYSSKLFNRLI